MNRTDSRPLFGVWATVALAGLLSAPFLVTIATRHEPFPAVLFPMGPGKLRTTDGQLVYEVRTIVAHDLSGNEVEIPGAEFLDPIPVDYLMYLADSAFGRSGSGTTTMGIRGTSLQFEIATFEPTQVQHHAANAWFRRRLAELGLAQDSFLIRTLDITANAADGREVARTVTREVTIAL